MVTLDLTDNEWFILYTHVNKLLEQYSDNKTVNSIHVKLSENHPKVIDKLNAIGCSSFRMEYTTNIERRGSITEDEK